MVAKADLEAREAECNSVEDFVSLTQEALADPADSEYAKELLQKAELQCQMPPDYIRTAEAAAALGDKDYAKDLCEQAEEACFEAMEFAALAHSLAGTLDDKDKASELLARAADAAKALPEFLTIARHAKEDLGDEELAGKLLARVEEKAKTFEDFADLAKAVQEQGDEEAARTLYSKAARFCDDIPATVAFAKGSLDLFNDTGWARKTLEDAETDCQFTKQFVELAQGYKQLFDDMDKVRELMGQAAEFAMSGEEQIDLANGYWTLLQDKEAAAAAYDKALAEITDKDALLALAKQAATELDDKKLAQKVYTKAEGRMSSATELSKLAQAVVADVGDKEYAAQVYQRAADGLAAPNDLMLLAGDVLQHLGDRERATNIYRKALTGAKDLNQLTKLLERSREGLEDPGLAREILEKAEGVVRETPDFVAVAKQIIAALGDKAFAQRLLEAGEERVTSIGEMKAVTETVKAAFGEDSEWVARVEEKLAKREANQAKYASFQQRENEANTPLKLIRLGDAVMAELEDRFYTQKLLANAEKLLTEQGSDFTQIRELVLAINRHLNDQEWNQRLLDEAAERCTQFPCLRAVAKTAVSELTEQKAGKALARRYYQGWEQKLAGRDENSAYDYTKLAEVAYEDLIDGDWARTLIDRAAALGGDHFAFAQMGRLATLIGDQDRADGLLRQASQACQTVEHHLQLALRLRNSGIGTQTVRDLYARGKQRLGTPLERLSWAEGILQIFQDNDWARREYDELESQFSAEPDRARYRESRRVRLENRL